jgi:hypothetical protein
MPKAGNCSSAYWPARNAAGPAVLKLNWRMSCVTSSTRVSVARWRSGRMAGTQAGSSRSLAVTGPSGTDWQASRLPFCRSRGLRPGACSHRVRNSPSSSSNLQLPQPPALHS